MHLSIEMLDFVSVGVWGLDTYLPIYLGACFDFFVDEAH